MYLEHFLVSSNFVIPLFEDGDEGELRLMAVISMICRLCVTPSTINYPHFYTNIHSFKQTINNSFRHFSSGPLFTLLYICWSKLTSQSLIGVVLASEHTTPSETKPCCGEGAYLPLYSPTKRFVSPFYKDRCWYLIVCQNAFFICL